MRYSKAFCQRFQCYLPQTPCAPLPCQSTDRAARSSQRQRTKNHLQVRCTNCFEPHLECIFLIINRPSVYLVELRGNLDLIHACKIDEIIKLWSHRMLNKRIKTGFPDCELQMEEVDNSVLKCLFHEDFETHRDFLLLCPPFFSCNYYDSNRARLPTQKYWVELTEFATMHTAT